MSIGRTSLRRLESIDEHFACHFLIYCNFWIIFPAIIFHTIVVQLQDISFYFLFFVYDFCLKFVLLSPECKVKKMLWKLIQFSLLYFTTLLTCYINMHKIYAWSAVPTVKIYTNVARLPLINGTLEALKIPEACNINFRKNYFHAALWQHANAKCWKLCGRRTPVVAARYEVEGKSFQRELQHLVVTAKYLSA